MDVRLSVTYLTQILRALENAHRTVIHRDIKPENLILMPGERIKVLDWPGQRSGNSSRRYGRQQATNVIGTLAYTAPSSADSRWTPGPTSTRSALHP